MIVDARRFGASDEELQAIGRALLGRDDIDAGLWPDNVAIVEAFLAVASQWRTAPIGGGLAPLRLTFIGLDYAGALAGIAAAGIVMTPTLWDGVRVMEAAARAALNGGNE